MSCTMVNVPTTRPVILGFSGGEVGMQGLGSSRDLCIARLYSQHRSSMFGKRHRVLVLVRRV